MTYNPLIPVGNKSPASQVNEIKTNFAQFGTLFAINHSAFNIPSQGDHEAIILERQTADPGVTQDLDVIYSKNANSAMGTQPQLFLQIPEFLPNEFDSTVAKNTPMQLTYNQVGTAGPVFQSFLAGGFLFYFGTTNNIAVPITLSPTPSVLLIAIAAPNNMTIAGTPVPNTVSTTFIAANQFKINSSTSQPADIFSWMAIATV